MSKDAAVVAIVVSLALGWYGNKFVRAHRDADGARAGAQAAGRAAWRATLAMAGVGFIIAAAFYSWVHGRGR